MSYGTENFVFTMAIRIDLKLARELDEAAPGFGPRIGGVTPSLSENVFPSLTEEMPYD